MEIPLTFRHLPEGVGHCEWVGLRPRKLQVGADQKLVERGVDVDFDEVEKLNSWSDTNTASHLPGLASFYDKGMLNTWGIYDAVI